MTPEVQEIISFAKWVLGGAGAVLVTSIVLVARASWHASKLDEGLKKQDKILIALESFPMLVQKVEILADVQRGLVLEAPRTEKRLSRVEWELEIVPTGKHSIVPAKNGGPR
jgi:hypothetical protein